MKLIAILVTLAVVLLAAAGPAARTNDPRAAGPSQGGSGAHMDRHVDAHVQAREGESTTPAPEPARRKQARDPFRGAIQPTPPSPPSAVQPPRDRLY